MPWEPIVTAPKDGTHILVAIKLRIYGHDFRYNHIPVREAYWSKRSGFWKVGANSTMVGDFLTHWMPLPDPPSLDGSGGE